MSWSPNDSANASRGEEPDSQHPSAPVSRRLRLVWSPLAERQALEAVTYIAANDPAAASRWIQRLLERVESLISFPDSGRVVPEYGRDDVREIMVGAYRVMYRRRLDRIEIAAVHHHARGTVPFPD